MTRKISTRFEGIRIMLIIAIMWGSGIYYLGKLHKRISDLEEQVTILQMERNGNV